MSKTEEQVVIDCLSYDIANMLYKLGLVYREEDKEGDEVYFLYLHLYVYWCKKCGIFIL